MQLDKFAAIAATAAALAPAERLAKFRTNSPLCAASDKTGIPLWVPVRRADALRHELAAGPIGSLAVVVSGDLDRDPDGSYFLGFRAESQEDTFNRWNPAVAALGYPDPTA